MIILQFADSAVLLGLIYCGIALSLALSLRILDFPDLTIEGSVPLGGAITAIIIEKLGNPWLAISAAAFLGFSAGIATALFHTKLKISKLLSGIIMLTILYSLNLRVMGASNVGLLDSPTVFSWLEMIDNSLRDNYQWAVSLHPLKISFLLAVIFTISVLFILFLKTDIGLRLRAVGDNRNFAATVGINPVRYIVLGLGLSNALAGVCGGLIAMNQGFSDVGMGQGLLVLGLASLIIGEKILIRFHGLSDRVKYLLYASILGSLVYQGIFFIALKLGLPPTDLKMGTALIVLLAMAIQYKSKLSTQLMERHEY
jgi:putative ABC transport system permease protein